ncbi:MAG: hypothetical protein ACJ76K_08115 [Solirubrobacteraceae bacterium]
MSFPRALGDKGDPGTVDTSNFFTKTESDARYERSTRINFGSAGTSTSGSTLVEWASLGYRIVTVATALGHMQLAVQNIGANNINGFVYDPKAGTQTPFGLNPGQTSAPVDTTGPFLDFSIVGPSAAAPPHAVTVHCMNQPSGGAGGAYCFAIRSDNS